MSKKIYRLLDAGPKVKFTRTTEDGQKIAVEIYNPWRPHLRYRVTTPEGKSQTLRFLRESDSIDQAQQIKDGFLANLPFSTADRRELDFINGEIETDKVNVQKFLDAIPHNKAYAGDRTGFDIRFEEFIPVVARKLNLALGKKQAQAALAMHDMAEEEMDIAILKIHGSAFQLPVGDDTREGIESRISAKMEILQNEINDNEAALDIILEAKQTDTVETIIGKAVNAGVLSFIEQPDAVMIKRDGKWVKLLAISDQHDETQKQQLFRDRLESEDGKPMLKAITEQLIKAQVEFELET